MKDKAIDAMLIAMYSLVIIGTGCMFMSLAVLLTQSWWGLLIGAVVNTVVMLPLILWFDHKVKGD